MQLSSTDDNTWGLFINESTSKATPTSSLGLLVVCSNDSAVAIDVVPNNNNNWNLSCDLSCDHNHIHVHQLIIVIITVSIIFTIMVSFG